MGLGHTPDVELPKEGTAFTVTFLLRSGRDIDVFIQDEEGFKDEDELHTHIVNVIEDRENGMFKPFGEATILFSQIDGWTIQEYAS